MKASSARIPQKKPKLGQHFLNDSSAALRIVHALGDISQSTVLEIGPGGGALTSMLVRRARRVIAIETDRVLAAQLRMNFSLTPNIEVIEGDILAVDFDTVFGARPAARVLGWSTFQNECASSETCLISSPQISCCGYSITGVTSN